MSKEPVRIGQIVGAHGLKGQVKVLPLTDFLERFEKGARLRLKNDWVTVESFSIHKNRPLIKLSGIDSIDAAEKLQWEYLETILEDEPELDEDEFLTEDLIDCLVVTTDGRELGTVDDVLAMPAHDVLQIGEILIPVVKEFIKEIDLDEERITVQLIPGMLPGEEPIIDRPD
ncbi:MAG: ribosome maturation factor RimM [Fimbriimonas sp.]